MKNKRPAAPTLELYRLPASGAALLFLIWVIGIGVMRRDLLSRGVGGASSLIEFFGEIRAFPFAGIFAGLSYLSFLLFIPVGLARPAVRKLSQDSLDGLEEVILSLGLGLGALSISLMLVGSLISFSSSFLRVATAALFVVSAVLSWKMTWKPIRFLKLPESTALRVVGSTALLGLIVLNLMGALGPEVFFDSLSYHLALPQLYLLHGKIFPTPYNVYSGIPFNTEMLYGLSLSIGGELLAKLLPWTLSLAIVGLIGAWCRRFFSGEIAWIAALLFYSCPMVASQTWFTLVELNWCFFALLALFCVMMWSEQDAPNGKWLALAGVFVGFCLGVKYNAVTILPVVLGAVLAASARRKLEIGKIGSELLPLAAFAAVLSLPWLIKNWAFYQNPIYPFFDAGVDWRGLVQDAKGRDIVASFTNVNAFKELFSGLWGSYWGGFDSMGLALLLGLPLLALVKGGRSYAAALIMVGCSWLAWLLTTRMPRFLIFAIPILSIAIAVAIEALKPKRLHHGVAISIVMCACVLNCGEIFINWRALGTWKVVLGGMNREEYLSHSHKMYPTPYYPAVDFINKTLPSNAKVLFFEESRGFYCEREFIAVTPFAVNPLVRMVEESSSPEELERKLKSENITHLLINRAEIMRRGSAATAFTKRGEELFAAFSARYLKLLFERKLGIDAHDVQWVQVYELG